MEIKENPLGLLRALGPFTATAIVAGTVIGSGVFKKPQTIAANVPGFDLIAMVWILGGVLALLGALTVAEVTVLFPRAGGNYVFLREGYGRLAGFLWGWVEFWIIRSASIAALATIFIESLHDILRQMFQATSGEEILSFWASAILDHRGFGIVGRSQYSRGTLGRRVATFHYHHQSRFSFDNHGVAFRIMGPD